MLVLPKPGVNMRNFFKWTARIILLLMVVMAAVIFWKREEITRLMAVNSLFSEEKIIHNFSHMDAAFLTTEMTRGDGPISPFAPGPTMALPDVATQWIKDRDVTALVVLKDGQMVFEDYFLGTEPEDRRISWSVAKSLLSALFGIILQDGDIDSINDPVIKYAPALEGTAYRDASILNVLQMSSGVTFDEDYLDYDSDINKMGRVIALGGSIDEFAAGLSEQDAQPGQRWQYVSIDTHVIGMVIRGATGRTIPDLLQEKILLPMGLEGSPFYITDGYDTAFVLGGLNLSTRDYARIGQMFLQGGQWNGQQIIPADWVVTSTTPSAKTAPGNDNYGYQWWMAPDVRDGEYFARGIYGQYIYINTPLNVVIATNAADRNFRDPGELTSNIAVFRAIAEGL